MEKKEHKLRIVRYSEVPCMDPERFGKTDIVLNVLLEDMTTEIIQIPKEDLSEEAIQAAVRAKTAEREKWQGKELTY